MSVCFQPDLIIEKPASAAKKRIIICCDGTGNSFVAPNYDAKAKGSGENSNVVKFYTALEIGATQSGVEQIAYYHPGVGTMGSPLAHNWLQEQWSIICGLAFGRGFRDNVLDAYRYLMENYNDNGGHGNQDEIYIVGFSRGAYTARALAGLLHGYGLLCRGNEGHLLYAWRMYVDQHKKRGLREIVPNDTFRMTFSHKDFNIRFLGVWDTVSSVGWIYTPLRLFNIAKNDTVQVARHAVSIDERRCFYTDNLWGEPAPQTNLVQAWFAGAHSDVGGSYKQDESGLSDITLKWMLDEARNAGNLYRKPGAAVPPDQDRDPDLLQFNDDRLKLVLGKEVPSSPYAELLYRKPKCEKLHNELKGLWLILEYLPHIYYDKDLGEYHGHVTHQASDDSAEVRRIPRGAYRQIPDGALIHGSVVVRQQTAAENLYPRSKYDPPNLRKGKLEVTGTADLAGIPYYVFREPLESREANRKKPNPLKLFFQSGIVMLPLATVELIVLLSIILVPVGVIGFLILHFLLAGFWCILRHVHFLVVFGHWLVKYPAAWK